MIAWLAPGQGMERAGMGRDVGRAHPAAHALLHDLEPGLHGTDRVQPALVAVSLGAARVLQDCRVPCDVVAGHSLGELTAWALAGGLSFRDAIDLARLRGRAMAAASRRSAGGMWALPAVPDPMPAHLRVAVHNPGQVVLSGPQPGPPGASPVPTDGAWHSEAMRSAIEPVRAAIEALPRQALHTPIVRNHDGSLTRDDAVMRDDLVQQLVRPVHWSDVLRTLGELGISDIVLLGPGRLLAQQIRSVLPGVSVHRTDRAKDLEATVQALG